MLLLLPRNGWIEEKIILKAAVDIDIPFKRLERVLRYDAVI